MKTLEAFLLLGGLAHLIILAAAMMVPRVLNFREQLRPLSPFMRHLVWVYAGFIAMTIGGFGLVTLANIETLAAGGKLARWFCGLVAVFWGLRLVVQFFVFDVARMARSRLERVGFHLLTVAFTGVAIVFACAAIAA